jgi:hypothetical protein
MAASTCLRVFRVSTGPGPPAVRMTISNSSSLRLLLRNTSGSAILQSAVIFTVVVMQKSHPAGRFRQ